MRNKEAIQKIVGNFLSKNNIEVPINLNYIARIINALIIYYKFPKNVNGVTLKVKKGCVKGSKDAEYLILINTLQSNTRKRFTIAHEIGHILLKHNDKMALYYVNGNNINLDAMIKIFDRDADIFASELLMPTSHIMKLINYGIKDAEVLSGFYNVSKSAVTIKIKECNSLSLPTTPH